MHYHLFPASCYPQEILKSYENREAAYIDAELNEGWDGECRVAACDAPGCRPAQVVTLAEMDRKRDAVLQRFRQYRRF